MTIKQPDRIKHHYCEKLGNHRIWFSGKSWSIVGTVGLEGVHKIHIHYCPFCGEKLPPQETT